MKKFLALLLAALMLLAMFTACAKTATPSQEETTAPTETANPPLPRTKLRLTPRQMTIPSRRSHAALGIPRAAGQLPRL